VLVLDSLDLTEGQRRDCVNYELGQIVEYQSHAKGARKGQQFDLRSAGSETTRFLSKLMELW
jgi:hypothetical protein